MPTRRRCPQTRKYGTPFVRPSFRLSSGSMGQPTIFATKKSPSRIFFLFPFIVTPIETIQLNRNRSLRNISVRTAVDIDRARHVKRGIALKKRRATRTFHPINRKQSERSVGSRVSADSPATRAHGSSAYNKRIDTVKGASKAIGGER